MSRSIVQKYGINRFNNEASNHKSSLLLLAKPKLPLPYRTYSRTYHIYRLFCWNCQENTKYVKQKIAAVVIVQRTEGGLMTFGFLRLSKPSS